MNVNQYEQYYVPPTSKMLWSPPTPSLLDFPIQTLGPDKHACSTLLINTSQSASASAFKEN